MSPRLPDHDAQPMHHRGEFAAARGLGYAMAGLVLAGCLAGIVLAVRAGDHPLVLLLVCALAYWLVVVYTLAVAYRLPPSVETGVTGLTFRQHRRFGLSFAAMSIIGLATCGPWAVLGMLGAVAFPFAAHDNADTHWIFVYCFALFAVMCAVQLAIGIRCRFSSYLRLTPAGFCVTTFLYSVRGDWSEVVDVSDETPTWRPPWSTKVVEMQSSWNPITFTRADGTKPGLADARPYATDVDAVRNVARFYWQHPKHREELADESCLARLTVRDAQPARRDGSGTDP